MENEKQHIIPYTSYIIVLLVLLILTGISVSVTRIELGTLTVTVALIIASIKSTLVLRNFMHLKFENRFFTFMVFGVIMVIFLVIVITFLDYLYRD